GRRDLMERIAPAGPVYQAGTLSGNPLAMAAGLATLDLLAEEENKRWHAAERWAASAAEVLERAVEHAEIPLVVQRVGTIFTAFFIRGAVQNYAEAKRADRQAYARFFHRMLDAGVYLPPSPFEAAFSSAVHASAELGIFEAAVATAFERIAV
ncbi:MAG TPA: aminotransferase class III-fold pyridoxal phosphate-dependent enzyme, partial [Gemmatimonadales bacterium]|nr:aminotransferase class III-fold pyridoxal phosphate-dependent enzyme [Gemmatimonadales bacterium]